MKEEHTLSISSIERLKPTIELVNWAASLRQLCSFMDATKSVISPLSPAPFILFVKGIIMKTWLNFPLNISRRFTKNALFAASYSTAPFISTFFGSFPQHFRVAASWLFQKLFWK